MSAEEPYIDLRVNSRGIYSFTDWNFTVLFSQRFQAHASNSSVSSAKRQRK